MNYKLITVICRPTLNVQVRVYEDDTIHIEHAPSIFKDVEASTPYYSEIDEPSNNELVLADERGALDE